MHTAKCNACKTNRIDSFPRLPSLSPLCSRSNRCRKRRIAHNNRHILIRQTDMETMNETWTLIGIIIIIIIIIIITLVIYSAEIASSFNYILNAGSFSVSDDWRCNIGFCAWINLEHMLLLFGLSIAHVHSNPVITSYLGEDKNLLYKRNSFIREEMKFFCSQNVL